MKRRSPRLRVAARDRQMREDLAVEVFTMIRLAMDEFGVRGAGLKRVLARSQKTSRVPRVSGPILRDSIGLGVLLLEWSKDAMYLDAHGKPRVLPIEGPGPSFEGLARKHLPKNSLKEAVRLACATAEVSKVRGGKIALLGGVMVKFMRSNDTLFQAHFVRQVSQLVRTLLHNRRTPSQRDSPRLERLVTGIISPSDVRQIIREFKPQIYDLFQRIESAMDVRLPQTARKMKKATALSVGLFVSQEDDLARVGMDGVALQRQSGKRK